MTQNRRQPAVDVSPTNETGSNTIEAGAADAETAARAAIAKAIEFVMSQQGDDGSFKSKAYGPLKQGPVMTSLALYAMGHAQKNLSRRTAKSCSGRTIIFTTDSPSTARSPRPMARSIIQPTTRRSCLLAPSD